MKRLVCSVLIAIPISIVLTVFLLLGAGFMGGACHCMTPISVLFPYGTFITMRTSGEALTLYLDLFQFPLYTLATLIPRRRLVAFIIVLIVHSIAAVGALTMYRWW